MPTTRDKDKISICVYIYIHLPYHTFQAPSTLGSVIWLAWNNEMWAASQLQVKDLRGIPCFLFILLNFCTLSPEQHTPNSGCSLSPVPRVRTNRADLNPNVAPSASKPCWTQQSYTQSTDPRVRKTGLCYELLRSWVCLLPQQKLTNVYINMHYFMFILCLLLDFNHSCTCSKWIIFH